MEAETEKTLSGMTGFTIVWLGQVVSLLGTSMTNFALTIWAWEVTGKATALALMQLFFFAPTILMSPVAGALVDRWNRKLVMILSDLAAGLGTIAVFVLYSTGVLEVWNLYIIFAFMGAFQAFQFPAYSAAVSTMISKEQYTRASGMLGLANSASGIFGPIAAGVLLGSIGTTGILGFDIASFVVAIVAVLTVSIPQPVVPEGPAEKPSLLEDSLFGFRYILQRPSLLGLQLVFFFINFSGSLCFPLIAPMILTKTGGNTVLLGSVQSAMGAGGLVGGLILSAWGGPKKKVNGVLAGMVLSSLLGMMVFGLGDGMYAWLFGSFMIVFFIPFVNGSNQAIWQSKIPPAMQGRVFSARALIAQVSAPIAMVITGPLTDNFLLPAMDVGGALAPSLGWLIEAGPGAGISLLFVFMGLAGVGIGLSGYLFPHVRDVETLIPDHDEQQE
jgi:DHA3 family macrolide efflux protein-like MFS transporter